MKFFAVFLAIFLLPFASSARSNYYDYFNTDAFWQKLVLEDAGATPQLSAGDTVIAVASNRSVTKGTLRFASEERDETSTLHYFVVYTSNGKWHILPCPSLSATINTLPQKDKDWVVYTEGMGKIFTTDLDRGLKLSAQYSVNVLLLDYPSIHTGYSSVRNYRFAYSNARDAYKDFVPVLDTFRQLREAGSAGSGHLTLFFHSMGNNVMRKIVQENLLFLFNTHTTPWVDNLVLNAPCVPRRGSAKWVEKINFAKRIYVHYNNEDFTLKWARLAGFRQIMGEHAKRPAANATYINFNSAVGNGHSYFLNLYGRPKIPSAVKDYFNVVLRGKAAPNMVLHSYNLTNPSRYRKIGFDFELLPSVHF